MVDPKKTVEAEVTKLPFLLLLTSVFLRGFTFILLNGPPLELILREDRPASCRALLIAVVDQWKSLLQTGIPLTTFSVLILLSIVVGMVIEPIEKMFSTGLALVLTRLASLVRRPRRFFSLLDMGGSEKYVRLLGWIFMHREQRQHWEWELFLSYLHWGVATNVLTFVTLCSVLLRGRLSVPAILVFVVLGVFFLTVAVISSSAMAKVHDRYLDQAENAVHDR